MKKTIYYLFLFAITLFTSPSIYAQIQQIEFESGDSIFVELDGYKQGVVKWQRNTGTGSTWSTIATDSEAFKYRLTTPAYFRTSVEEENCDPVISDTIQANMRLTHTINAGHGYSESTPFVTTSGITMSENGTLRSWSNINTKAVWFLYHRAGTYKVNFNLAGTSGREYGFELNTTPAFDGLGYTPEKFTFSYTGKGTSTVESVEMFTITIPTTGYYRYELGATSSTMSGLTINTLQFNSLRTPGAAANAPLAQTTTYLTSPSVHLGFSSTATTSKDYDWIYEEILVPEGCDPLASYYMSLGFFAGYMGIQTNSATERRVLFSVWDIIDTDVWPDAPKEALVSLVDKASYTTANSFGGEGTGGQSYVGAGDINTWKTGTPVKFLMNTRRDGGMVAAETISNGGTTYINKGDSIKHAVVSAWYDAGEGWRYVATWRAPRKQNEANTFDGFYSFLECYGTSEGQAIRKAYYYNAYGKERTTPTYQGGKWINLNKVSYGNTDGGVGQRIDFEQGVPAEDNKKFYMLSGGYGQTLKTTANTTLYVDILDFPELNNLDLKQFEDRVDQALEREKYLNNLPYLEKTTWQLVSFSSEEASGESNGNGKAALIIDGDDATYWHSRWTGGGSSLPHYFVIDIGDTANEQVKGFKFVSSGGTSRYPKNTEIQVSNSSTGPWTEVFWQGELPISPDLLEFDTPLTGYRYIRLYMKDGYSDPPHTRMNEIYAF